MNRTKAKDFWILIAFVAVFCASSFSAAAQNGGTETSVRHEIFVATAADSYLRYLQTVGRVPLYPWSSRPFSQRELRKLIPSDSAHPWSGRFGTAQWSEYGVRLGLIQPTTTLRFNSAFPYGSNDGPVWAGRGLTHSAQAGFYAEVGPLSLIVAPMAFRAQNRDFNILTTDRTGNGAFGDPVFGGVDRPQRFGASPYEQVDPGQTTLRIDLPVVSVGASTANQEWGPGQELPVILGNNAAGFPHLFIGTSEAQDIFIGRVSAKIMWGELFQSDYSSVAGPSHYVSKAEPGTKRFTTGVVFSIEPRGLTGLELGGIRFFHSIWPTSGIPRSYVTKVFQGILKKDIPAEGIKDPRLPAEEQQGIADNQLISVFFRWVLPRSGFEVHAEYGRDDHSYDFRDLTQEPDHSRAYSIGARKVFSSKAATLTAGRVEIMNFQLPQLARYRGEGEMYVHGLIRQGHTYKGQLLGADVGVGTGAGSVMAVDRFTPGGRWTVSWTRIVRQENGNYTLLGVRAPRSIDVSHAVGLEASTFMSEFEFTYGVTLVRELNRDFKSDATNINALLGLRYLVR